MALKAKLSKDDHAKLDASTKALYVEKDGNFLLDVAPDDGYELVNARNYKEAISSERALRENFERTAKLFEGVDPKSARDALAYQAAHAKGDDAVRRQLEEKHANEMKDANSRIAARDRLLDRHVRENTAKAAIAKHRGDVDLLLPHVIDKVMLHTDEKSGDISVRVKNADGSPRISEVAGNNGPMGVEEFVGLLKNETRFGKLFEADPASGGGMRNGTATPASGVRTVRADQISESAADLASGKAVLQN